MIGGNRMKVINFERDIISIQTYFLISELLLFLFSFPFYFILFFIWFRDSKFCNFSNLWSGDQFYMSTTLFRIYKNSFIILFWTTMIIEFHALDFIRILKQKPLLIYHLFHEKNNCSETRLSVFYTSLSLDYW